MRIVKPKIFYTSSRKSQMYYNTINSSSSNNKMKMKKGNMKTYEIIKITPIVIIIVCMKVTVMWH